MFQHSTALPQSDWRHLLIALMGLASTAACSSEPGQEPETTSGGADGQGQTVKVDDFTLVGG